MQTTTTGENTAIDVTGARQLRRQARARRIRLAGLLRRLATVQEKLAVKAGPMCRAIEHFAESKDVQALLAEKDQIRQAIAETQAAMSRFGNRRE